MNLKVRNSFAVAAVGALACSLASAPLASAEQNEITEDVPTDFVQTLDGDYWGRVSGQSRFGTAVAASKALENHGNTVIIANSTAWVDTLGATPLADVLDAPVLYTYSDKLHPETTAEIKRLFAEEGVTRALIVGGNIVVKDAVADEIAGLFEDEDNYVVDRVGEGSRYDTSLLLAAEAIDYYEDGIGDLAEHRAAIRALEAAEAAYQAALANWNDANDATGEAFDAVLDAQEAVDEATAALAEASAGLVEVPGAPDPEDLTDANNAVIAAREVANDHAVLVSWVNGLLNEYSGSEGANFSADPWSDVEAYFGSESLSVTLSTGTYTGTLANLSTAVPYLSNAVATDSEPAKQVEQTLVAWGEDADDNVSAAEAAVASIIADIVANAEALENNEALQDAIADAYADLEAAQDELDGAVAAYFDALDAEADAEADLVIATNARPSGSDFAHANLLLATELAAIQADGRKYPSFLATGLDFPDALAAGPAAASEAGVILLTRGTELTDEVAEYLENGSVQVAVGGPAAAAAPDASEEYVGASRYETATLLAAAYFDAYDYVGLASGAVPADAVIGGALMANVDSTLVLTRVDSLPQTTADFLSYGADEPQLLIFGGPLAINNDVRDAAIEALQA